MYIKKIKIENIRFISEFEMTFDQPAGWHVLIGDNGSGKSTIIRSIALCLIGPEDILSLRLNLKEWLPADKEEGFIQLILSRNDHDSYTGNSGALTKSTFEAILTLKQVEAGHNTIVKAEGNTKVKSKNPRNYVWSGARGWFSAAFGPFRRFTGGDKDWEKVYYSNPRAAAHLSAFGEDVALTQVLDWLKELDYQRLKAIESDDTERPELEVYRLLRHFLNTSKLLPQNAQLMEIGPDGPLIVDGNGNVLVVTQMSDGFRSVLSLLFELIRQLIRVYGYEEVFKNSEANNFIIDLPGVVLIDEVDVHLHPTWQTKIGQWFTKYFPNIQFIVTTHSPLVCRAAENGSIWQLPAPGTDDNVRKIEEVKRNRLIYGNILDAYGTGLFGDDTPLSESANDKLNELADLNVKSMFGQITPSEEQRLVELKSIFSTQG